MWCGVGLIGLDGSLNASHKCFINFSFSFSIFANYFWIKIVGPYKTPKCA
jgi:hypothetical protein